jgi:hypothetical protein
MRVPVIIAALLAPAIVAAQDATFKGRVLTDTTEVPIEGVIVSIDQLKIEGKTDSTGTFVLRGVKPGAYVVTAKKIGYTPLATRVRFTARETVEAEFLMTRGAQRLPEAKVETKPRAAPKLIEFEQRRAQGQGRFLTQTDFDKRAYSWTSDVLRQVPGMDLIRDSSRPTQYYVTGGRLQGLGSSSPQGGQGTCFAAVVLDGIFVFQALPGETPFDINSLPPGTIAGFEYYSSAGTIPAKYNGSLRNTCGLAIIWTRI